MSDMEKFNFALIASGFDHEAEGFEDALFEAGCDDATVSAQKGLLILDFCRESVGIANAIKSAISDVESAGGHVLHVEPDNLVSMADIACRAEVSRQSVHNWATGKRCEDFPLPVARVMSDHPLWEWAKVAAWLFRERRLPRRVLHEAKIVSGFNRRLRNKSSDHIHAA